MNFECKIIDSEAEIRHLTFRRGWIPPGCQSSVKGDNDAAFESSFGNNS